ncbi:MAG: AAA family ATPase [Anaeroplasmataceae bacterium]|nr:AAA family ATPase [Anaeroplasmataceae bacterium]
MIKREHYIKEVREFYDSNLIKIITGIRRSGKSVILGQIKEEIQKKSDNVIYLTFENKSTQLSIPNANSIIEYVRK